MELFSCPGCSKPGLGVGLGTGAAFEVAVGQRVFKQPHYEILACKICGLYYKSAIVPPSELTDYYTLVDFSKWDIGSLYPSERMILDILRQLPLGSRILDYGCSDGRLLAQLGTEYQRFGFDINEHALQLSYQKGVSILSTADLQDRSDLHFDAIILSDTFEHLLNPTEVLRTLRRHLSVEGLLIVFSGNADAKLCQRDPANFWYFRTIEHVCMLSKAFANFICDELNLRLLGWTEMCHYKLRIHQRIRELVQDHVYWRFCSRPRSSWASILRVTPVLRRAEAWPLPPAVTGSKDHVLAVFTAPK